MKYCSAGENVNNADQADGAQGKNEAKIYETSPRWARRGCLAPQKFLATQFWSRLMHFSRTILEIPPEYSPLDYSKHESTRPVILCLSFPLAPYLSMGCSRPGPRQPSLVLLIRFIHSPTCSVSIRFTAGTSDHVDLQVNETLQSYRPIHVPGRGVLF